MPEIDSLTPLQIAILAVFWALGEATATRVHEELEGVTGLSRKTIGTLLARLESYGFLEHREEGREFVYRTCVTEDQVREAKARSVLDDVFEGNVSALVSYALETREVEEGDIDRIRALIDEWESKRRGRGR
jgi:predicted transcriptional regulator